MKRILHFRLQTKAAYAAWARIVVLFWQVSPTIIILLLLLAAFAGLVPGVQVQITRNLVESVSAAISAHGDQRFVDTAFLFGLAMGSTIIVLFIQESGKQYFQNILQMRLSNRASFLIMEKATTLDIQHFEDDKLYDKLQRAMRESAYRPHVIFLQLIALVTQLISLLSVLTILVGWDGFIAFLILFSSLPSACSQAFFARRGYQIERNRSSDRRRMTYLQYLTTNARSSKEVRLFQLGDFFLRRYLAFLTHFYKVDRALATKQMLVNIPLNLLSVVVMVGAYLYTIRLAIEHGQIGLLAGYIQALYLVYNNTQSLMSNLSQLYEHTLYIKNLFEFLDTTPAQIKSGSLPFPQHLAKGIEFRHVSFSYPGTAEMILHDLNLFFPAHECIALVGHNGAGKTTLIKLLARLYEPTEGQIFIDDIPLEAYDLQDLRKHISVIFQDFVPYEMTVQENIGFGYVTELENSERVQRAARESGIAQAVEKFPQLYQTTLGRMFEDGQELSLGQWQKVALARVFMRRAPIVILDEPTASIDAEAETEVFGRLREIAQGATTLLIAHRFSTVRMADRILVLEHGQVVEEGTHESLLHANGTYAHLFHLQAAGYVTS